MGEASACFYRAVTLPKAKRDSNSHCTVSLVEPQIDPAHAVIVAVATDRPMAHSGVGRVVGDLRHIRARHIRRSRQNRRKLLRACDAVHIEAADGNELCCLVPADSEAMQVSRQSKPSSNGSESGVPH